MGHRLGQWVTFGVKFNFPLCYPGVKKKLNVGAASNFDCLGGTEKKVHKSRHFAKKKTHKCCQILGCVPLRGGTHSEWVPPLRWNPIYHGKKAEPRNSGLCPFERRNPFYPGIFFASAIKKNSRICIKSVFPVILITLRSFSVLKGGTHSILAKRRN